jgi:4-hydroxybenzoate polyprenyltransferase
MANPLNKNLSAFFAERLVLLIKTSRPVFWIIQPLIFLVGLFFALGELTPLAIFQAALLSFPYCIFLYGINDIHDYESDKINPRKQLVQGVKLEPKYHSFINRVSAVIIVILAISSLITFSWLNILGMAMLLFFSYFYSAPPLRLKTRPPLDSFSNGLLYFLGPALMGGSFGVISFNGFLKLIFITICVMGLHAFSTLLDLQADKQAGDKTFGIVFGKRIAILFALLAFLTALLLGGFNHSEINYLLFSCVLFFAITLFFPYQKLVTFFGRAFYLGGMITAILYILHKLSEL